MEKQFLKNKEFLRGKYEELGSTRKVGKYFGVSNGCVIYWMRKHSLPRIPKLYLYNNNSGRGRRGELYVLGHPYFKKEISDMGGIDDKYKRDLIWKGDGVNVKTSHSSKASFRIKKSRHDVQTYVCLAFDDKVSQLVPREIYIIPAKYVPHTTLNVGKGTSTKYAKYRLSLLRGREFSEVEEKRYSKKFEKNFSRYLPGKTGGNKND